MIVVNSVFKNCVGDFVSIFFTFDLSWLGQKVHFNMLAAEDARVAFSSEDRAASFLQAAPCVQ